jgi:DNA-binding transcriptional ArsR family regulator
MTEKRRTFSQRTGIKPLVPEFRSGKLNVETRTRLWNHFLTIIEALGRAEQEIGRRADTNLLRDIWTEHYKQRLDQFIYKKTFDLISNCLLNSRNDPSLALDFLEYIIHESSLSEVLKKITEDQISHILEEENASYRLYPSGFIPIASELEIKALSDALDLPESAVTTHLKASAAFLKKKDESHIRNSIKESISAVLAAFYLICNERQSSISGYLKLCKKRGLKVQLNPCFQLGFAKFYDWTSGEQGIRHEILEGESPPSYADAQFMLHVCAAAVNMLLRSDKQ